jgi:hypothetical protein
MSASDGGTSRDWIARIVRSVVTMGFVVQLFPKPIREFFRDPEGKVREWVLNIVLAFVANIVFTTTELIDASINAIIAPFTSARVSLTDAIDSAGQALITPITELNDWIATGLADALGFGAFPFLVTVYVLEIALVIRVGRAAIPALSDTAGAIPVVGSLVDGLITFFYRFLGGSR